MGDESTSYTVKLDSETDGIDAALGKLGQTEESIKGVDKSSLNAEAQIKALNKTLQDLRAPGEIKRLTKEVEEFGKTEGIFKHFIKAALDPFLERAKNIAEFEFIRRGVDALIEAPGEIVEKLKELGEEMILTAAKAERLDQSFKLTLGQEGAEQVLGWIERISSKTEFTDDQLKGWSSELLRAGVKMQDVDKFLAAGLDTAAKSTNKLEGMGAAISALSRAQLTGRVEGRALRGLSIGVDQLKELPQFKGLDDKSLHKKMEEGSISKNDLLTLIAGKDGVLGDLGLVAGKTFEAQLKNVKEIPEQIYQGLYKTAGFQKLGGFLGSVYDSFGPDTAAGKGVQERLGDALDLVATKLQGIDLDQVAKKVSDAFEALPEAIETTKTVVSAIGDAFGVLGSAIEGLTKVVNFVMHPFEDDADKTKRENAEFTKNRDPVEAIYEGELRRKHELAKDAHAMGKNYVDPDAAFGPQEDALTRAHKRKDEIRKELAAQGKLGADGLAGGATDGNPKIEAAGASMGDALKEGTAKATETRSPSRALFRLGAFAGEGYVDGIESQRENIEDAMFTAFSPPEVSAPETAAGAGSGSPSITIDIGGVTITAGSNDPETQALAFADALRQMLPGALISAFDGVRAQAGQ
jgi:tape measure domain-containing protein